MSTYGSDANLGAFENSFSEKSIRHGEIDICILQLKSNVHQ